MFQSVPSIIIRSIFFRIPIPGALMNDILRQVGKRRIFKSFSGAKYTFVVPGVSKPVAFKEKVMPRRKNVAGQIFRVRLPPPIRGGYTPVGSILSINTSESTGRRKVSYVNVRGQLHKGGSSRSPPDFIFMLQILSHYRISILWQGSSL